jgi:hypothetical protein
VTIDATKSGSVIKRMHCNLESDTSQHFVFTLGKLSMLNASTPKTNRELSIRKTTGILPISPRNGEEGKIDTRLRDLTKDSELIWPVAYSSFCLVKGDGKRRAAATKRDGHASAGSLDTPVPSIANISRDCLDVMCTLGRREYSDEQALGDKTRQLNLQAVRAVGSFLF